MRALAGAALLLLAPALAAQSPRSLLRDARQAFFVIELDRARTLAERALVGRGADTLSTEERADALMLLGTVHVLQRREAGADDRFRELVLMAPQYEPDPGMTPSAALQAFLRVRESTKVTLVELPSPQRVAPGDPLRATVGVSSLHEVSVVLLAPGGDTAAVLWSGAIRTRQDVTWDGAGAVAGRYTLAAASRERDRVVREVRIPLTITVQPVDTLVWPARPDPLPEHRPGQSDVGTLATSLGIGAAVLLAPAVARAETGTPARVAVAGALSLGGVLAFFRGRRAVPLEDNMLANRSALTAWERQRDAVTRQNAERRQTAVLDVRAGPAERVER